ncbi:MAG: hypothetical protein U0U09_09240 [Cyclobacteriaceae bacterium]
MTPTQPQNIVFQWTPRHTGSPNSAFSTEYDIKLVELWPVNRNPNDAILTSPPILETTTRGTTFIYDVSQTPLEPGRHYALQVKAKSIVGADELDLFKNNGKSEVITFIYGDACNVPQNILAEASSATRFTVKWTGDFNHTGYSLRYRVADNQTAPWYTTTTLVPDAGVSALQPNTTYEFQVAGGCGVFESAYSGIGRIKTLDTSEQGYACGMPLEQFNLDPANLLDALKVGDVIQAGDFDVKIAKVSGSGGTFAGEGVIEVPFFNKAKVKAEFSGVVVNKEMRMVSGYMNVTGAGVDVIPSGVLNFVDQLSETLSALDTALANIENNLPKPFDEHAFVADTTLTLPGPVVVDKDENGNVIITDAQGGEHRLPKGTEVAVVDDQGNGTLIDSQGKAHSVSASVATAAANREYNLALTFKEAPASKYGFDAVTDKSPDALKSRYRDNVLDGKYYAPYKSIETGATDFVVGVLEGGSIDRSKVRFEMGGIPVSSTPFNGDESTITVSSKSDGLEQALIAVLPGATEKDKDQVLGRVNVVTYEQISKVLHIVPVNGNEYKFGTAESLQRELNRIYGQAIVNWSVTIESGIQVEAINPFDVGQTSLLTNYTDHMKKVISAYKTAASIQQDENNFYLFLVNTPNDPAVAGYMPRSKQFGFIFYDHHGNEPSIARTMAHELGHGAFNLHHTFMEENFSLSKNSTDNLMDYAEGTKLYKYQWDMMRSAPIVMGLFEVDEEGASEVKAYLFTVTDEINLNELDFGTQVNYVTPGGELISLAKNVKVSFTGLTQNQQLNSTIAKGILLGLNQDGVTYGAVLTFSTSDKVWKFKGYKDYNSDSYYPQLNVSENSSTKKVLIGREAAGCGLSLIVGDFNGKEHDKVLEVYLQSLHLSSEVVVKEIQVPDCDRFKTESATYFFTQSKSIHGVEQLTKFRQIAALIDELGDEWYKEFREAENEVIRKPKYRYVSLLNSSAKPEDFDYFLKSITKYKEAKDQKFEKLIQVTDPDALSEICSVLTPADYMNLSLDHRKHILSTLVKDGMHDHYLFANNEEGIALRVLKSISTPTDSKEILDYLENTTINKTVLVRLLNDKIDDAFLMGLVGDKNYTEMMKVISKLIASSSDYTSRLDGLVSAFNKRLMVWGISQESVGAIRVEDIEFNNNGKISSTRKELVAISYEDGPSRYGEFSIVRKEDWSDLESPELSPFDLIIFVNKTDLSAVNFATESATGQYAVVPAIYLPFAKQKGWNSTVNSLIINTTDIAVILSSGGTAAVASGISKARRAWLAFEALNAAVNLTINLSGVASDPKMKDAVEIYNSVTMVLAIGELSYGGAKKLSAIMDQIKALPSVKALFIAQVEKLSSALNKIDGSSLSPTSKRAYDRMMELVHEVKGVGGLAKYAKVRSYLADGRIKAILNNQQLLELENLLKTANDDVLNVMEEFKNVNEFAEMVRGYKDGLKTMPDGTSISEGFVIAIKRIETFSGSQGWLRFWKLTPKMEVSLNTITELKIANKLGDIGNATEIQLASIHAYTANGDFINQPFRYQPTWFGEYNTRAVKHINEGLDELRKLMSRKVVNERVYSGKTFTKADFDSKFVGKMNAEHPYNGYMSTSKLESVAEGFIELTKKWAAGSGEKIAVIQRVVSKNGVYIDDISDWGKNLGRSNHSEAISKVQIQEEVLLNSQKLKQVSEPIPVMENGVQKTIDGVKVYYIDFVEIL